MLAEGFMPRALKRSSAMVGLVGLACVTHPMLVRQGDLAGGRLGLFEVADPLSALEVRDEATAAFAAKTLDAWWKAHAVKAAR